MPTYRYKAASPEGELFEGEMESPDRAAVISRIQELGQIPIRAEPVAARGFHALAGHGLRRAPKLAQRDVALFTQELSSLLHAGLPLDRSLQIMIEIADDRRLRELASRVQQAVRGGAALSAALEAQGSKFSRLYISLIRASEAAGALDVGLARIVEYLERAKALRDNVISALVYPVILVVVAGLSLIVILTYVVPQFTQLFADMGRALPVSTQVVITAAELLRTHGWLLALLLVAGVLAMRAQSTRPAVRYRWHRTILSIPLFGDLARKLDMARLCRSLGTLIGGGVPLLAALAIAKESMANEALSEGLAHAAEHVKNGRGLADQLLATGQFPALGLQMIRVGEETGRLDVMLLRVATVYDREVEHAVRRMLTLLEPALIIGMGLVIAGIIMSILVAILSINELPM